MNSNNPLRKSIDLVNMSQSSGSSNDSIPKNKNRLNLVKRISTKKNTIIDHLKTAYEVRAQSSTLFQSEKWDFKPKTEQ